MQNNLDGAQGLSQLSGQGSLDYASLDGNFMSGGIVSVGLMIEMVVTLTKVYLMKKRDFKKVKEQELWKVMHQIEKEEFKYLNLIEWLEMSLV